MIPILDSTGYRLPFPRNSEFPLEGLEIHFTWYLYLRGICADFPRRSQKGAANCQGRDGTICDSRTRGLRALELKKSLQTSRGIYAYLRGIHARYIDGRVLKYTGYTEHAVFFVFFLLAFGHWGCVLLSPT